LHNLFIQREKLRLKYQKKLYERQPENQVHSLDEKFLNETLKIIEEHYQCDTFRIEDVYHQLGVSRVQLHRKLTVLTGQSASNFIRSFRLHKARKLLLETELNISEVACKTGFSDPNYFTRAFTEENGVTPSEFRKSFV
jgi:AraC-like DNA-binding protein